MAHADRGVWTSTLHRVPGATGVWEPQPGVKVPMPVILDMVVTDSVTGLPVSVTEATIDLVDAAPAIVSVSIRSDHGLATDLLQARFRWSGPLEVVTRMVPRLIRDGIDPFEYAFPTDGFPGATHAQGGRGLSDEFLEDIARRYVQIGRGYSHVLAEEYVVSPRTVVSWVEKARMRGILGETSPGRVGGRVRTSKN